MRRSVDRPSCGTEAAIGRTLHRRQWNRNAGRRHERFQALRQRALLVDTEAAPAVKSRGRPAPGSGRQALRLPGELDEHYARWRDEVCNRRIHATGRFAVAERLAHEREVLRPLPPTAFDFAGARPVRVALDGYPQAGRQLLPGAAGAGSSARRAALRSRLGLDRRPRSDRRATGAAMTAASGSRRGCDRNRRHLGR